MWHVLDFVEFVAVIGSITNRKEVVEAEAAISQMLQEGVSIQGSLAGDMARMAVIGSIKNRKEMVSIDQFPAKRGEIQGIIKYREMGRFLLCPESTKNLSQRIQFWVQIFQTLNVGIQFQILGFNQSVEFHSNRQSLILTTYILFM